MTSMGVYHRIGRWQMLQRAIAAQRSEHDHKTMPIWKSANKMEMHMIHCLRVRYAKRRQAERGGSEAKRY